MVLSKKSWHYWIYRQFFERTPTNFCPYFWKIFISTLIIVPAAVICIPFWALNGIFGKEKPQEISEDFGAGAATIIIGSFVICMVAVFFSAHKGVYLWGMTGWVITGFVSVIGLVGYLTDKISFKGSFLGNFVEAKKNKHCPKIEWAEDVALESEIS